MGIGVEVSLDDFVIMDIRKRVKLWCEIGGTAENRWDVNVMNVEGDIVEGGCNGEVLSDGVMVEEGVGEEQVDEGRWDNSSKKRKKKN